MASKFDNGNPFDENGVMDKVFEKVTSDSTGKTAELVDKLINVGRKGGEIGLTMQEIAGCVTLGYFISKDPQTAQLYEMLKGMKPPDDDECFH